MRQSHEALYSACDVVAIRLAGTEKKRTEASKAKREKRANSGKVEGREDGVSGRWTAEEHEKFLAAIELYGRDWKKVQLYVGTRSTTQTRSHAQKYFAKAQKSEPPTAASSPNSKPLHEAVKARKRTGPAREVVEHKGKSLDSREETVLNKSAQREREIRDNGFQLNEYIGHNYQGVVIHPWYQIPYDANALQPVCGRQAEEVEIEFDNVLPEPVEFLELSAETHGQAARGFEFNGSGNSNDFCILNFELPLDER